MLALGLDRGRVMLVDEETGEVKWDVEAHSLGYSSVSAMISTFKMSSDGRFVASVGCDGEQLKLFDVSTGALHRVGATHDGTGACICVEDIPRRLLQEGCPVVAHTAAIHVVAFSPCGGRFATGDRDGAVIVWDAETGKVEYPVIGHSGCVRSLSISADGERLASGCVDRWIRVWGLTTRGVAPLDSRRTSESFAPHGLLTCRDWHAREYRGWWPSSCVGRRQRLRRDRGVC